jgi:hypothetical protein
MSDPAAGSPRRSLDPEVALTPEVALDRYRRTGDPAAFGALFDATAAELHRAALSMLPDADAADDVRKLGQTQSSRVRG